MGDENADGERVEPGARVYNVEGELLGRVSGLTQDGFEVEAPDPDHPDGVDQEELPGKEFGEGYLMWRCDDCGEMGDLDDGFPESCPNCGAPREVIEEVRED